MVRTGITVMQGHPTMNMTTNIIPRMTFGKYKGQTFLDVFVTDISYCLWCIERIAINRHTQTPSSPNMVAFAEFCKFYMTQTWGTLRAKESKQRRHTSSVI
jgi:hypothetical protein